MVVEGLASKPELNGSKGTATSFDDAKGRYNVKMWTRAAWHGAQARQRTAAAGGSCLLAPSLSYCRVPWGGVNIVRYPKG